MCRVVIDRQHSKKLGNSQPTRAPSSVAQAWFVDLSR